MKIIKFKKDDIEIKLIGNTHVMPKNKWDLILEEFTDYDLVCSVMVSQQVLVLLI